MISLGLAILVGACARPPAPLPPGLLVQGRTAAARAALDQLQGFEGAPIAATAAARSAELAACAETFSLRAEPEAAKPTLRCEPDPALATLPSGHDLAFALPEHEAGRLIGWLDAGDGLRAEVTLARPVERGAWGLLLPAAEAPGPLLLSEVDELIHVRARAARVSGLAELVQEGGQGDAMFGLKSGLFASAVLDGTWEFAAWMSQRGDGLPLAALAVGVRDEDLARTALRGWVDQLEATWNISLTTGIPDLEGCFLALNTLPGLAPCGAIRDHALIVGWNEASLRHALAPAAEPPASPAVAPTGALVRVAMARFPAADRAISLAFAPEEAPPQLRYPWSSLELRADRLGDAVVVTLQANP